MWNFQKADFDPYYASKKYKWLLFLFLYMGRSPKMFACGIPLHAYVFSFTYKCSGSLAVVFTQKIIRFLHFNKSKQMSLTQELKWSLEQSSALQLIISASNWFVTLYYKLLPPVSTASKHGRQRSSFLLYSISMLRAWWVFNLV